MKTKTFLIGFFGFLIASSCEKDKKYEPDCSLGHCVNVGIRGVLHVNPSGKKLSNVPVEVFFVSKNPHHWFAPTPKVASGRTNKDGVFNFNVTIDTSFFATHNLTVRVPCQKDYLSTWLEHEYITQSFRDYDEKMLRNINFEFYIRTTLTIIYTRTEIDHYGGFHVEACFDNRCALVVIDRMPELGTERVRQFETAADIYTKITWIKANNAVDRETFVDSLIPRRNENNVFIINY